MSHWIETHVPEGTIVDRSWLRENGINRSMIDYCLRKQKLVSVVRGVYRRPGVIGPFASSAPLKWQGVVYSLAVASHIRHVAARTALRQHGILPWPKSVRPEIVLARIISLPGWLGRLDMIANFRPWRGRPIDTLPEDAVTTFPFGTWDWPIPIATPELALLELLAEADDLGLAEQALKSSYAWDWDRFDHLLALMPGRKVRRLWRQLKLIGW